MHKKLTVCQYDKETQFTKFVASTLMATLMFALFAAFVFNPVAAAPVDAALDGIMETVLNIITTAALYVGIVIVLWGVFQIIMALRREDSEAIGKQITTVVVGGVLVGFGGFAETLFNSLMG